MTRRFVELLLLACVSVLWVSLALRGTQPTLHAFDVQEGVERAAKLPWTISRPQLDRHLVVRFDATPLTPNRWQIIPDDELVAVRLNGAEVSLSRISRKRLTDYERGFTLDLGGQVRWGSNELELTVNNHEHAGGLRLYPRGRWSFVLIGVGFLPWLWGLARVFRVTRGQRAVLLVALVSCCAYWSATAWNDRTYDAGFGGGHMGYVTYVAEHWALPNPQSGWSFYHPPLYYVLSALVWSASGRFELPGTSMMQAFSLALWLLFLASSAGALRIALGDERRRLVVATATVALWPSSALHGVRVGNDAALYATAGLAVYFLVSWWYTKRERYLTLAALCIGLAFVAKSNAAILAAAFVALVVLRMVRGGRLSASTALAASLLLGAGVLAGLGNAIYHYRMGHTSDWLVGNIGTLDDSLRVPLDVASFIPLEAPTFLTQPWVFSRGSDTGRTNFWNFMFRSALSGEFGYELRSLRLLALVQGALLLTLVGSLVMGLLQLVTRKRLWSQLLGQQAAPWTIMAALWFASLLALRIKAPFSCSNDFRYIVPILVPLSIGLASRGRWAAALQLAIAVSSVCFSIFLALG